MRPTQRVGEDAHHRIRIVERLLRTLSEAEQKNVSEEGQLAIAETALILCHSAFHGVMKNFAERAGEGEKITSQRETWRALDRLRTESGTGSRRSRQLTRAMAALETLSDKRHKAYYMEEPRERDPGKLAEAVRKGMEHTLRAIEVFAERAPEQTQETREPAAGGAGAKAMPATRNARRRPAATSAGQEARQRILPTKQTLKLPEGREP